MRTTVRFWRWRRNTLRRRTDRAEAWVVLVTGLLLFLAAPAAGLAAGATTLAHAPHPGADWHRQAAVLVRDAPVLPVNGWSSTDANGAQVRAQVRWTPSDGAAQHTGEALVAPGVRAGQHVSIWVDGHGTLHDDPTDPAQTRARAVVLGLLTYTTLSLAVLGLRWLSVVVMGRRRAAALDREWARIGPTWGHRPA